MRNAFIITRGSEKEVMLPRAKFHTVAVSNQTKTNGEQQQPAMATNAFAAFINKYVRFHMLTIENKSKIINRKRTHTHIRREAKVFS